MGNSYPIDLGYVVNATLDLCRIPSPTGFTKNAIAYVVAEFEKLSLPVTRTVKGSVLATLGGARDAKAPGRLLSAHVDTLGAMVKQIKPSGRLVLTAIGGYDWSTIEGEYCIVHTRSGGEVTGTILTTKSSTHIHGQALKDLKRNETSIEVRLDAETESAEETSELGISVGDFVSLDPRTTLTPAGFIKSRHLDDKACVACLLSVAKTYVESGATPAAPSYLYFSTFEEVGHGTSAGVPAGVEEIVAVDMAAVGEGQTSHESAVTICMKDGSGPYDYDLSKRLIGLAERDELEHRVDIYTYYASDVSQAQRAGYDIRGALVGPGVDASHSYERLHKRSLLETTRLLMAYLGEERR